MLHQGIPYTTFPGGREIVVRWNGPRSTTKQASASSEGPTYTCKRSLSSFTLANSTDSTVGGSPKSVGPSEHSDAPCRYAFMSSAVNAGTWPGCSLSAG